MTKKQVKTKVIRINNKVKRVSISVYKRYKLLRQRYKTQKARLLSKCLK